MHNQQHLQINNVSKLAFIVLSTVLLTGLAFVPVLQIGVNGQVQHIPWQQQQQQQPQQNQVSLSQVIKQIAEQVATSKPGADPTHIQKVLIQLAKETKAQTADTSKAIQTITQIQSQITSLPRGQVTQALLYIAKQETGGSVASTQLIKQVAQLIDRGVPAANALVQIAIDDLSKTIPYDEDQRLLSKNKTIVEKTSFKLPPGLAAKALAGILDNRTSVPDNLTMSRP
jgi:hypothetical protein